MKYHVKGRLKWTATQHGYIEVDRIVEGESSAVAADDAIDTELNKVWADGEIELAWSDIKTTLIEDEPEQGPSQASIMAALGIPTLFELEPVTL